MDNFQFRELGQPNFTTDSPKNKHQQQTTTTNNGLGFFKEIHNNNTPFQGGSSVHGNHLFSDHTTGQRFISFQNFQFNNNSNPSDQGHYNSTTSPFPAQHQLGMFQFRNVLDPTPPPLPAPPSSYGFLGLSSPAPASNSGFIDKDSAAVELLEEIPEIPDIPDTCFNYISELLKDDNPYDQPLGTLQEYMAYQAVYQSFTDTLSSSNHNNNNNNSSFPSNEYLSGQQNHLSSLSSPKLPIHDYKLQQRQEQNPAVQRNKEVNHSVGTGSGGSSHGSNSCKVGGGDHDFFCIENQNNQDKLNNRSNFCRLESSLAHFPLLQQALLPAGSSILSESTTNQVANHHPVEKDKASGNDRATPSKLRGRNLCGQQEYGLDDGQYYFEGGGGGGTDDGSRKNKQQSITGPETYGQISEYEEDLFCPEEKPSLCNDNPKQPESTNPAFNHNSSGKKGSSTRAPKGSSSKTKKQSGTGGGRKKSQVVDLAGLLILCSESVARMDFNSAREQLKQIRQHASPSGDNNLKRLAHYFANAIEARLTGLSGGGEHQKVSPTDYLRANRIYVAAVPFQIMSYYVANKTIAGLTMESDRIHIIDFGIGYGLQWPCIISNLAKKEPHPPRVKITGIDFPERGMRPSERLDETGRCLGMYCERFGVEFEYKGIVVTSWEEVRVDELGIEEGEMVVVNCLYRGHELYDESVDLGKGSPRDEFLRLVRRIEPSYFVHGVVNGSFSAPYFAMRFKEAVSYYGALFDVFESTMPRGEVGDGGGGGERVLLEEKVMGMRVMNVVACEGKERIERPESYRRWKVRMERSGFKQSEIDGELIKRGKAMVGRSFRKEFLFGEENQWAVQGWKGKILYAISLWRPKCVSRDG